MMWRSMRVCLLVLWLLAAAGAQAGGFWPSLWRSADQRGEQLLQQGDAAAAARTYADPRRRAYAELMAGDYAAAAHAFAAFDDSDAHYNRGNALAHVGDLAAALKAYDSALARDPNNRDARHNRDLVEKALQQQPPQPKQSGGLGQSGRGEKGKSAGQSGGREQGERGKSSSGQAAQAGKPGEQGRERGRAGRDKAANAANPGGGQNRRSQPAGNDAEASLGREARRNAPGKNATIGQAEAPRGEQQLAQEQWLRQIPDDPGGLLRRKFMIEHLLRQQGHQR